MLAVSYASRTAGSLDTLIDPLNIKNSSTLFSIVEYYEPVITTPRPATLSLDEGIVLLRRILLA